MNEYTGTTHTGARSLLFVLLLERGAGLKVKKGRGRVASQPQPKRCILLLLRTCTKARRRQSYCAFLLPDREIIWQRGPAAAAAAAAGRAPPRPRPRAKRKRAAVGTLDIRAKNFLSLLRFAWRRQDGAKWGGKMASVRNARAVHSTYDLCYYFY